MKETDSNKEFIPYEQAVALKELGFEEYCLRYFMMGILNPTNLTVNYDYFKEMIEINKNMLKHTYVLAPLYQQAFRWFRKKYNLICRVDVTSYGCDLVDQEFYCAITSKNGTASYEIFDTYEKAELDCLKKLIEIVTKK